MIPVDILLSYSLEPAECNTTLLSSGLINSTWKISCKESEYIIQRINTSVFKNPDRIARNLELLSDYLSVQRDYLFNGPIKNKNGKTLTFSSDEHAFRIFPYVKKSY